MKTFLCLALFRRTSFRPPSMVYISVIILQIVQITIFHMLNLCGQLWAAVFLTCGYSSCLLRVSFQTVNLIYDYQSRDFTQSSASTSTMHQSAQVESRLYAVFKFEFNQILILIEKFSLLPG